ncbi:hypothetical protein D3C87_1376890 [compost metagenome]
MARAGQVLLHQHLVVAEAGRCLALDRGQRGLEALARLHHAHALAAAARAGLDQHRVADAVGLAAQQRRVLILAVVAGHQRHGCLFHQLLGRALAAHGVDGRGRRADEDQPLGGARLRECLVLGQEAVARVDGLGTGLLGHLDDVVRAQVAVARGRAADMHGFVAERHMARVRVRIGVDGHRADAQPAARGRHAAGNLATVGDQDLVEHGSSFVSLVIRGAASCLPHGRAVIPRSLPRGCRAGPAARGRARPAGCR